MTTRRIIIILFISLLITVISCEPTPVPKPRAFFRIDLPEKEYKLFDLNFPYSFQYPVYSEIDRNLSPQAEPWWINIDVPEFKASIHLSYKEVANNLTEYLDDTHKLLTQHISKATGIREDMVLNESENVYGIIYHIRGVGVASTCQFFVTDSINHFLRGALYFKVVPNNDSLAPVIDFLKEDIQHIVATLQWK